MMHEGTWWISSKSDPRWDKTGSGLVGGFSPNQDMKDHVAKMERELGCAIPDDLEYGYFKD